MFGLYKSRKEVHHESIKIQPPARIYPGVPEKPQGSSDRRRRLCNDQQRIPEDQPGNCIPQFKASGGYGEIQRFSSGDGSEHFDYNTDPHYHFVCKTCGAIIDMPLELVRDTSDLLTAPFPGRVDSHTVFFYGECEDCRKKEY